jgi:hypothetical protein
MRALSRLNPLRPIGSARAPAAVSELDSEHNRSQARGELDAGGRLWSRGEVVGPGHASNGTPKPSRSVSGSRSGPCIGKDRHTIVNHGDVAGHGEGNTGNAGTEVLTDRRSTCPESIRNGRTGAEIHVQRDTCVGADGECLGAHCDCVAVRRHGEVGEGVGKVQDPEKSMICGVLVFPRPKNRLVTLPPENVS